MQGAYALVRSVVDIAKTNLYGKYKVKMDTGEGEDLLSYLKGYFSHSNGADSIQLFHRTMQRQVLFPDGPKMATNLAHHISSSKTN